MVEGEILMMMACGLLKNCDLLSIVGFIQTFLSRIFTF